MSKGTLRSALIKLAADNPNGIRAHLLPLLKTAMEFNSQGALDAYLKAHPDADRSKHSVVSAKELTDRAEKSSGDAKKKSDITKNEDAKASKEQDSYKKTMIKSKNRSNHEDAKSAHAKARDHHSEAAKAYGEIGATALEKHHQEKAKEHHERALEHEQAASYVGGRRAGLRLAGGDSFINFGLGSNPNTVFKELVAKARNEGGSGGYSGTIAEKRDFTIRKEFLTRAQARIFIDEDTDNNAKWGPAFAVSIVGSEGSKQVIGYCFYGIASS